MLKFCIIVQSEDATAGLPVSFDTAVSVLCALPRLFIEPDGSFVWRGETAGGTPWQVDGNLIDRGTRLSHVESSGRCPADQFDQLLRALGWPEARLAFQIPRRGKVLTEAEFRRQAALDSGAV